MADEKEKPKAAEEKPQDEGRAKAATAGKPDASASEQQNEVQAYAEPIDGSSGDKGA